MPMKIFVWFGVFFLLFAVPVLMIWVERRRLRLKYLQKISRINVLKRRQYAKTQNFYVAYVIEQSVKILFLEQGVEARRALADLSGGRINKAVKVLQSTHPELSCILLAHTDLNKAFRQENCWSKKKQNQYKVFQPMMAHKLFKTQTFLKMMAKTERAEIKRPLLAYYDYMAAYTYLQDADMLSASQSAERALKAFQKKGYPIEEAECYLLMAEIYRLSCMNDVAQMMIESALKIFRKLKNDLLVAEATAVKGMLMVYENRLEEAEDNYVEALDLAPTETTKADILNQYALLHIVRDELVPAKNKINRALAVYKQTKNQNGLAFGYQLLGQIALQKQQYRQAVKDSLFAAEIYEKLKNYAATAESLYMAASAEAKQAKYKPAEEHLRQILILNRNHPNSFHSANAYALLGLIYLQTGNYRRAKVLFQQSLHLEQRFERCEGLVADYANLALIEKIGGDENAARNNLQIALEYARQTNDMDLIGLIEKKINMSA